MMNHHHGAETGQRPFDAVISSRNLRLHKSPDSGVTNIDGG